MTKKQARALVTAAFKSAANLPPGYKVGGAMWQRALRDALVERLTTLSIGERDEWVQPGDTDDHELMRGGVVVGMVERSCCIWVPRVEGEQVGESCDLDEAKRMVERAVGQ